MSSGIDIVYGYFSREPRGTLYVDLISALGSMAPRILLVIRREVELSDEGKALLEELAPSCTSVTQRAEWPGTKLHGNATAEVREYSTSRDVLSALSRATSGLYGWQSGLPEDLAFIRDDGAALMDTIAHEGEGGLSLTCRERDKLLSECPSIAEYVEWR